MSPMETTRKPSKKSVSQASEETIIAAYKDHLLMNGARPASVYKFSADMGIREEEFYNFFGSFDAIEKRIWKSFIERTTARLHADETFSGFSAREKILSFYFTLLEELRSNRSFILLQLQHIKRLEGTPVFLRDFRESFEIFVSGMLLYGKQNGEIATRPFIDERYPQLFWLHMGFILLFWKNDDSPGFEKTDAAIEKSVNLAFDLIGKGAVDSAFDFGKFLYQNR